MKIEVLYVRDCPSHPSAVELVKSILASKHLTAEVQEILVTDHSVAVRLQFPGSPTIRINGRDVADESPIGHAFGLTCRLYSGSQQPGLPSADLVRRAVADAAEGERN